MIDPTNGLRAIRSCQAAGPKLLFLYVAPLLEQSGESSLIIGSLAQALGIKRSTVRRAIAILVDLGLLEVVKTATGGTAGVYRLGPTARLNVPMFKEKPRDGAAVRAPRKARAPETEASKALPNA